MSKEVFKTGYDKANKGKGVLVIYTGGTIGSMPKDPKDPDSPQVVVGWEKYKELTPQIHEEYIGFNVDAYSTEPLDSCNVGPVIWKEIAMVIKESYDKYEGFVILHGTDTMVYTASALSFMLNNLGKPVVITGAQMAYLFNVRNDGFQNMISALQIANPKFSGIPVIPEVTLYFNGKLLRGNRARKINASGFNAYISANYPPLATIGESIVVDEKLIREKSKLSFNAKTRMETGVVAINFFPGIQDGKVLERILSDPSLKGVVLMAYGAGNIPTDKKVLDLIKKTTDRGVVVLDVTQCGGGKVELGMYETSALLLDVGVVSGIDITPEAALTKLMYLLADEDDSPHAIALKVERDLAGEQSMSIYTAEFKSSGTCSVDSTMNRSRIPAANIEGTWNNNDIERIMLRFRNGVISNPNIDEYAKIKLFMDISSDDDLDENSVNYLGCFNRLQNDDPTILFFDITDKAKEILAKRASITVVMDSETASFTWEKAELTIFVKS